MDTEPTYDHVACAGYGTIATLIHLIKGQLDVVSSQIRQGDYSAVHVFVVTAESMVTAVESVESTPLWDDARTQMIALIQRYRDLLAHASLRGRRPMDAALAEMLEAVAILVIARDRLARRLGFRVD